MELGALPEGWARASVCDVGTVVTGNTPSTQNPSNYGGQIPFVKPPQLNDLPIGATREFLSELGAQFARVLPPFSILVSCIGNLGKTGLNKAPVAFNQQINAIVPASEISALFLFYQVQSHDFRSQLEAKATATTISIVNKGNFETVKLNIAPLAEQHRIVAKIEELFSELDQGVASLKTAREQLKVYRQSLLKNAFEGKLTAAWRAAHRDQLETAAALQQRIAREREARHQQQLADWQTAGQAGPKPKPPKPLPPLSAEELAELPELPAGWGWIRIGELVDRVTVGYVGPMKDEYIEEGVPFLRSQNVRENRFDPEGLKFVSGAFHRSLGKSALFAGDVVVVRSGSIGVSCVIPEHLGEANCSDLVVVKTPRHVSPHLLAYYMNWQTQGRVKQKMVGVALIHFNTKSVEGFAYPLCSEREQQQIEKLLAEKLSEADQLDQTLATALQQADALRQSILKKAFCGQLVKQDKNDEPATALLERIRAARSASPTKGRQAKLGSKLLPNY